MINRSFVRAIKGSAHGCAFPSVLIGSRTSISRCLHTSQPTLQQSPSQQNGSFFGELTHANTQELDQNELKGDDELDPAKITPESDTNLQEYFREQALQEQITAEKYINPVKRRLYELVVSQHGFYKNDQIVVDEANNKTYKLSLTPEEIDILEPSLFLQSYRIKSSMKKATTVNRFVRGWDVKTAINQLHFNSKKMATELEILLKRGLEQARDAGLNEDELYIASLWTGSDGSWHKRIDFKGRGRHGVIAHPYIHLKAVLKTKQTKQRIAWEKQHQHQLAKPAMGLINEPLNFKVRPYYKW